MKCPNCQSNKIRKNGRRRGKQNYHCKECNRQFVDRYTARGYSNEVKESCLKMYLNGLGFRAQGVCAQARNARRCQSAKQTMAHLQGRMGRIYFAPLSRPRRSSDASKLCFVRESES